MDSMSEEQLAGAAALSNSLVGFVGRWRATKAAGAPEGPLDQFRLRAVLDRIRRARPGAPILTSAPPRSLEPANLTSLVRSIREPLDRARSEGAFVNVWAVAGLGRNEVSNTAVLAWWLHPNANHGLGAAVLSEFLREALSSKSESMPLESELARAIVRTELRPQGDDTNRIDIAIDCENHIVWIEVKIDAQEGHRQLERYAEAARKIGKSWCLIYLSPTPHARLPDLTTQITWSHVRRVFRAIAKQSPILTQALLLQFARHTEQF